MSELIQWPLYKGELTPTTRQERRELIHNLARSIDSIIAGGEARVTGEPLEVFCNGTYTRTITLPVGTCAVGEIHKQDHINILSKGKVVVVTMDGTKIIDAPHQWVGQAGVKRACQVLEEAVWTTIHATTETTSEGVRTQFVAETYDDVPQIEVSNGMGSNSSGSNDGSVDALPSEPAGQGSETS